MHTPALPAHPVTSLATGTFATGNLTVDEPVNALDDRPWWRTLLLVAAPVPAWTLYVTAGLLAVNARLGSSMCCLTRSPTDETAMAGILVSQAFTVLYLAILGVVTLVSRGSPLWGRVVGAALPSAVLACLLGTFLFGV